MKARTIHMMSYQGLLYYFWPGHSLEHGQIRSLLSFSFVRPSEDMMQITFYTKLDILRAQALKNSNFLWIHSVSELCLEIFNFRFEESFGHEMMMMMMRFRALQDFILTFFKPRSHFCFEPTSSLSLSLNQ